MPKPGKEEVSVPEIVPPTNEARPIEIPSSMLAKRETAKNLDSQRESYWLGTLPGGEYQNMDFGGQAFPLFTSDVTEIPGEPTERFRRFGNVVRLLPEEVQGILRDAAGKVMQAGKCRKVGAKSYRWNEEDQPAGTRVYMVKVAAGFQPPAFDPRVLSTLKDGKRVPGMPWKSAPPSLVPRQVEAVSA